MGDLIIVAIFYALAIAIWQFEWLVRGKTSNSASNYVLASIVILALHATAMILMGVSYFVGLNIFWLVIPLVIGDELGTYFAKIHLHNKNTQ